MYAKYCGENINCEGLFNYNWQTEGAGQIVAFNSQQCLWGLKNCRSPRTDYNTSDVALPFQRFLKDVNFAVKLGQKRLNLNIGLCSVSLIPFAWAVCMCMSMDTHHLGSKLCVLESLLRFSSGIT